MATVPHSVSLIDADATRDELEALRSVMRSDAPYPDECPTLEDWADYHRWKAVTDAAAVLGIDLEPTEEDSRWWAIETEPEDDHGAADPDLTLSGSWDLPNGQYGYTREEP